MKYLKIPIYALAAIFVATPTLVFADEGLEEAFLFFELNDTDGDLGIHGKADGDAWKELEIEDPKERTMLKINVRGRLNKQGLTELFFESAEPCFPPPFPPPPGEEECDDPLAPAKFFKRFPEGVYEIEVETLEKEEFESEVYLSHIIPAAPGPDGTEVNGEDAAEDCEADLKIVNPAGGVTISWAAVTMSHASLPPDTTPVDIAEDVRYYEVVVEIDESDFNQTAIVPPDVHEWTFSEDFFELAEEGETAGGMGCEGGPGCFAEYKYEILVRVNNGDPELGEEDDPIPGNKSAMESCFLVEMI